MRFLWGGIFAIEAFLSFFAFEAWADLNESFRTWTGASTNAIIQTFDISRHFYKTEDLEEGNFFIKKRNEETELWHGKSRIVQLPLIWNLGLQYGHSSSPVPNVNGGVTDDIFEGHGGMTWEFYPHMSIAANIGLGYIPSETYRHGRGSVTYQYTLLLREPKKKKKPEEEDLGWAKDMEIDASFYYQQQREKNFRKLATETLRLKNDETLLENEKPIPDNTVFPRLVFSFTAGGDQHLVGPKTYSFRGNPAQITSNQLLNQYENDLVVTFYRTPKWTYSLGMSVFYYNANVDDYAPNLASSGTTHGPILLGRGFSVASDQMLMFPRLSIVEGMTVRLNRKDMFSLQLAETSYASVAQPFLFSLSPNYFRKFSRRWTGTLALTASLGLPNSFQPNPTFYFGGAVGVTYELESPL